MIEKLNISDIKRSSRRYPAIIFERDREAGDQILNVQGLSASLENEVLFSNIDINLNKGDKVVVYSKDSRATTAFYQILNGKEQADSGKFDWGVTTNQSYLPLDNSDFFKNKLSLVDWLRQWAQTEEEREEVNIRGFLGKMIFSGDLDLASITAFNNSLTNFKGTIMLTTHDHEFAQTVGNRIIELTPNGVIDRYMTFDEYMSDKKIKEQREKMYGATV